MDKNKLIGLILISGILIFYTRVWGPKPSASQETYNHDKNNPELTTAQPMPANPITQAGVFGEAMQKREAQQVILENKDVKICFTTQGGSIQEVILKNYRNADGQPLVLLDGSSSQMGFEWVSEQGIINTHQLYFETTDQSQNIQDNAVGQVSFVCQLGPQQYIRQTFLLPSQGYELTQHWDIVGLENYIGQEGVHFIWRDAIKRAEKDLEACRNKSTINYYLADNTFKNLKERSDKRESQMIDKPIQWVAIKQRFFTAGIIPDHAFSSGNLVLNPTLSSETTVKEAQVALKLPQADEQNLRKGKFDFYFGPNKYHLLKKVAPGFSKNLPLGWPVVKWINQFLIIPVFNFLEQHISNYGVIILLLVIFIKLLLFPLSYKSYTSMAEMKVLKPALDKLKSQYGNDLQKMQMEQARLYKEMGINPLSGCMPVFLQMPILLAMFNFFPNAIELRQQAFLWAQDLSTYDAVMYLPFKIPAYGSHVSLFTLLMTASTILYTWSNNQVNTPEGPMKTMSYLLPLTFMFVLNSFPAGLSFYYFVSNIITFGQQTLIKRFVDEEKIKAKLAQHKQNSGQSGKKHDFQARLKKALHRK